MGRSDVSVAAWTKEWLEDYKRKRAAEKSFEQEMDGIIVATGKPFAVIPSSIRAKYGNVPTDGEASKKQAKRLKELRLLNSTGKIRGLSRQVEYVLIPKQVRECGELIERMMIYIADFQYEALTAGGWKLVVEDVKGMRTPGYVMKRKLMLAIHGIEILET